jgi:hypothetical protein
MDAFRRTHRSTKLTADALFHAVFVSIENMATVQTFWLVNFDVHFFGGTLLATKHSTTRILGRHAIFWSVLAESN